MEQKSAYLDLGDVLVLGLGMSGKATVEYLAPLIGSRVRSLTVLCGDANEDSVSWANAFHADYKSESMPSSRLQFVFDDDEACSFVPVGADLFDLCIVSPGIPVFSEMYENGKKASRRIISEVELAWQESPRNSVWIAITGTNGKTTTTSLIHHIFSVAGLNAKAVGNIGAACISQVKSDLDAIGRGVETANPVYVAEMSSFQLASSEGFIPDIAVMLGIKPDHVEWHGSFAHYAASKMRLIDNMIRAGRGVVIADMTDEVTSKEILKRVSDIRKNAGIVLVGIEYGCFAQSHDGGFTDATKPSDRAFLDDTGRLNVVFHGVRHVLVDSSELSIKGNHNAVNSLAASSAAIALDVPDVKVDEGLLSFRPLEHRIEPCGRIGSIAFFNDSKATNVDSAVCAIRSFPGTDLIVLLGGHDKMTPLQDLACACRDSAGAVICYGEAKDRFLEELRILSEDGIDVISADHMSDAFDAAIGRAQESKSDEAVILLSPACSSFDEFKSFEERGRAFKEMVKSLSDAMDEDRSFIDTADRSI